ncbi:hypothetical protein SAICODRAFT_31938 [Saitoella complicata NRRL Y-17804]|uniref:uncharacterized protein n=1 Tax=Saitoella complicata (strain BCRC 22490 / CBS 7301 / JCM 7358 / NBRC 10748 / NRRL Y-17804) TaxID=698492 RepID=UPI0008679997|nr:uncharacterized protein SAICODRAFT_31938 [Saitoella complicata NRRL Y-17804]ODQ50395.1 hypothetical protein SAICODRAFT_31938 [Saitoella complicata NRRL Y-17804]
MPSEQLLFLTLWGQQANRAHRPSSAARQSRQPEIGTGSTAAAEYHFHMRCHGGLCISVDPTDQVTPSPSLLDQYQGSASRPEPDNASCCPRRDSSSLIRP